MKKVMIIGATSGIGKSIATTFASKGWLVAATGRRQSLLAELQQDFPNQIVTKAFDITDAGNTANIDALIEMLGDLDVFVYCAGRISFTKTPVWEIDSSIINLNVSAFAKCTGHVFHYFVKKGGGQIAVISSIAALRGGASAPAYNASKAFESSFAEGLNLQAMVLQKPIIVTDIKPGYVNTTMGSGAKKFWEIPVDLAANQIVNSIILKKRSVVITKKWIIIALMIKYLPGALFRKIAVKNRTNQV
jgi:short-subunit dehydrogenase